MVNIYIIHSGSDYAMIKQKIEPFLEGKVSEDGSALNPPWNGKARILTLGNVGSSWKLAAKRKIRDAQSVIFILGADADNKNKAGTIGWEIRQALKYNKSIMLHKLDESYEIPEYFMVKDQFTKTWHPISPDMSLGKIKKRIDDFDNGEYEIFSKLYQDKDAPDCKEMIFEQYKIYQRTSEDLVERRQHVNSFYQTVNSALITFMGAFISFAGLSSSFLIILISSIAGIILDISWINILESYGRLNSAKMKVLSLLERNLPVELYQVEWEIMSDKLNNKKYVSFTDSEKRIPKIFFAVYLIIIVCYSVYMMI